ncbi:CCL22 isoform 1 [Pan troglodytes]|uniref:C-C motif chemokine n=4 Tax=Homininae TaxID=207598 RepID=A0A6D2W5A1_PANTR|nr:C-C motif chemokine 22 [Pan troglodytes]XP_003823794.1 C-C motif chemokine 22 [Pan paniscus]XP_004057750.1 C-C motif chemokine 22 [Gorilla gorilla gorilla]XP_055220301.1 C-C motif chemokine 22 [Gorilla gorilla gorilla]PNI63775.1 CCL22 isoform 1 [Pan troglodytes]
MARLQTTLLVVLVLLAVALQATEAGPYGANMEDSVCCRDYVRYRLPLRVVKHFYWTSDSCPRPGVVLLTFRDKEICADPRVPWVKMILNKLSQ